MDGICSMMSISDDNETERIVNLSQEDAVEQFIGWEKDLWGKLDRRKSEMMLAMELPVENLQFCRMCRISPIFSGFFPRKEKETSFS